MPVRLTPERWAALADYWSHIPLHDPSAKSVATNRIVTTVPLELDGIVFQPAEYAPAASDAEPRIWVHFPPRD